jgi:hypothetical protein
VCRRRFLLRDEGRGLSRDCSTQCRPNCHASCDRGAGCRGAPAARSRSGLLGCARERDVLERLVAGVRAGQSRVLVLRCEAGVGKTSLLRHLSAAAEGAGSSGRRVSSPRWSSHSQACMRCARRCSGVSRSAESAARRVEHGVRPERRAAPGSLPRRAGAERSIGVASGAPKGVSAHAAPAVPRGRRARAKESHESRSRRARDGCSGT